MPMQQWIHWWRPNLYGGNVYVQRTVPSECRFLQLFEWIVHVWLFFHTSTHFEWSQQQPLWLSKPKFTFFGTTKNQFVSRQAAVWMTAIVPCARSKCTAKWNAYNKTIHSIRWGLVSVTLVLLEVGSFRVSVQAEAEFFGQMLLMAKFVWLQHNAQSRGIVRHMSVMFRLALQLEHVLLLSR